MPAFLFKTFLRNNCWAILWGIFIFLLTSLPGGMIPNIPKFIDLFKPDKLVHIFIFLIFVFLLLQGFEREGNPAAIRNHAVAIGLTIAVSIGGFTELLQAFLIPLRVASPYDFIANVLGSLAGWGAYAFYKKRQLRMRNQEWKKS